MTFFRQGMDIRREGGCCDVEVECFALLAISEFVARRLRAQPLSLLEFALYVRHPDTTNARHRRLLKTAHLLIAVSDSLPGYDAAAAAEFRVDYIFWRAGSSRGQPAPSDGPKEPHHELDRA